MKTNYRIPVVLGVLIVALNIIAIAVPVEKDLTFFLCDAFVVLALAAQLGVSWLAFGKKKGPLQNDPKKRARFGARKGFQTSLVAIFLVCEEKE